MPERNVRKDHGHAVQGDSPLIRSGLRTLESEAGGITALILAMQNGLGRPFEAAVEMIRNARGRVVVSGMGKSGHIGHKIAATLSSTGTPALFVHPAEASHGDLGMITPDEVIMALSWSGETVELKNLIDYSRRFRIGLIGVTAERDSTLGRAADIVLELPHAREACPHNLAPTTSSLMQLALGAALQFVRAIMHSGDALPLKPQGTRMSDAIVEMTAKGFGCVGIVDPQGRLLGIITDGDLRRHMGPNLLETEVDTVMTKRPITVRPDQLASEVLEILNSSKITALFALEGGKPVGIVHLHDLLRTGVA